MDTQLQELLQFLHDRNPQVRQIALENLLGQTPAGSPHRDIFFKSGNSKNGLKDSELCRDLKLLCRDQLAIAHDAFRALVNLTDSPLWIASLSDESFLGFLVSYILHPPSILADLAAMLLSNITSLQSVCSTLLSLKVTIIVDPLLSYRYYPTQSRSGTSPSPSLSTSDSKEMLALPFLLDAFAASAKVEGSELTKDAGARKGSLHFLSGVFANLSVTPNGRLFFLTPESIDPLESSSQLEYPIVKLTPFTEHRDAIRRGGVVSVIKNCCFHAPAHKALLSTEDEQVSVSPSKIEASGVNILPAILLPLAGPEELDLEEQEKLPAVLQFLPPTKKREPDSALRLAHIESLLLLCTTRWGRDYLRNNGTYEIIRVLHETEAVEKVSEHVERLVNLLKRDESDETTNDGDITTIVEKDKDHEDEDDSEDERIEEV